MKWTARSVHFRFCESNTDAGRYPQVDLNAYLAKLKESPTGVRTLADVIKFNNDNPLLEKPEGFEGQGR